MHLLAFADAIQLFPDGTLLIHVGLILLMIYILNRTLYRPINRIIESREKNKGGHSSEADQLLKEVGEKETRYNSELLDARSAGYELIEKEQSKAVAEREAKMAEAKSASAAKFESGRADLEKQRADAHASIRSDAETLADSITASILKG